MPMPTPIPYRTLVKAPMAATLAAFILKDGDTHRVLVREDDGGYEEVLFDPIVAGPVRPEVAVDVMLSLFGARWTSPIRLTPVTDDVLSLLGLGGVSIQFDDGRFTVVQLKHVGNGGHMLYNETGREMQCTARPREHRLSDVHDWALWALTRGTGDEHLFGLREGRIVRVLRDGDSYRVIGVLPEHPGKFMELVQEDGTLDPYPQLMDAVIVAAYLLLYGRVDRCALQPCASTYLDELATVHFIQLNRRIAASFTRRDRVFAECTWNTSETASMVGAVEKFKEFTLYAFTQEMLSVTAAALDDPEACVDDLDPTTGFLLSLLIQLGVLKREHLTNPNLMCGDGGPDYFDQSLIPPVVLRLKHHLPRLLAPEFREMQDIEVWLCQQGWFIVSEETTYAPVEAAAAAVKTPAASVTVICRRWEYRNGPPCDACGTGTNRLAALQAVKTNIEALP